MRLVQKNGLNVEIKTAEYQVLKELEDAASVSQKIGRALKPPPSEDPRVMSWRWFVVVVTTVNSLVLTLHLLLSWGWVPFFNGFAFSDDQKLIHSELRVFREEQLEWRIFNLRSRQCEAISKRKNPQLFTFQIDEAWKAYIRLTGHDPQNPKCSELIINGQSGND